MTRQNILPLVRYQSQSASFSMGSAFPPCNSEKEGSIQVCRCYHHIPAHDPYNMTYVVYILVPELTRITALQCRSIIFVTGSAPSIRDGE